MELSFFNSLSPQLATFLLAMLPITELRASIPIALADWNLPLSQAFTLSVLGNIVPGILILYYLEPVSQWLRRHSKIANKFFDWLFARTRRRFQAKYHSWGKLALLLFVAIPLPTTGVWTGSLAAWLLAIEKKGALVYIALGAVIAGVIVSFISVGLVNIFS